jgi:hypothetical protein
LNFTCDDEFIKQTDWFANIVRCDTKHKAQSSRTSE